MSHVKTFYAEPHIDTADGFGSTMPPRSNPHRGLDIQWPEATPVPSYVGGFVERVYWSNVLGNVVVLRAEFGWVGFCHLLSVAVSMGQAVPAGGVIGLLGSTGTASTGPHLHTTVSLVGNDPGGSPVVDPLPYIRAYRDGEPVKIPSAPIQKRKPKMLMCHVPQAASDRVSPKYAIFAPGFFFEFEGQEAANAWIAQIGAGPSAAVTPGTMQLIRAAALANIK